MIDSAQLVEEQANQKITESIPKFELLKNEYGFCWALLDQNDYTYNPAYWGPTQTEHRGHGLTRCCFLELIFKSLLPLDTEVSLCLHGQQPILCDYVIILKPYMLVAIVTMSTDIESTI